MATDPNEKPSKWALVKSCLVFTFGYLFLFFLAEWLFFQYDIDDLWHDSLYSIFFGAIPIFLILFLYNFLLITVISYTLKKEWKISKKLIEFLFVFLTMTILNILILTDQTRPMTHLEIWRLVSFNVITSFCLVGCTFLFRKLSEKSSTY